MYQDFPNNIGFVGQYDSEVADAMNLELKRQRRNIELIASENIVSPAVLAAMGTVLTNKYAEGYPGKRYYGGCECVDVGKACLSALDAYAVVSLAVTVTIHIVALNSLCNNACKLDTVLVLFCL